jgi:hypothetical protein
MLQGQPSISVPGAATSNPEAGRRGGAMVVLAGAVTTALALFGVWWLDNNTSDFHIMGWYANYVIPAGALIVGMAAGCGYGIASYLTGYRIRRGLLATVVLLQVSAYFAAEYLEFKSVMRDVQVEDEAGREITFARYYHFKATNFAWKDHGKVGDPLGGWGYLFLGLGVLGFAAGGILAPAILMKVPYCERCELYMKTRTLALVPASVRARRVSKKDAAGQAAYQEENDRAAAGANATLQRVSELAARNDAISINASLADFPLRGRAAWAVNKLPARMRIGLVRCRQCASGYLQPSMMTGQGQGIKVQALDRLPLQPDAVRVIAGSRNG